MTLRRSTAVVPGLASVVAAALLLVGVPVGLVLFVGWPLPTSLPDGDAVSRALRTGIGDEVIVNTLAVLAWLAWSQLVLGLVAEVAGVLRGRGRPRLPVLPAVQGFATRLVAGMLLLGAPIRPAHAMADSPPAAAVAEAAPPPMPVTAAVGAVAPTIGDDTGPEEEPPAATGPTVTVERHDSYWAIAERTLGDGLRWREIHELNVGRTMDDGHVIVAGDETLRAGWTLQLPAGATTGDTGPSREVVVEAGDNFWTIAEDGLAVDLGRDPTDEEVAPYWREVVTANDDRLVQPGQPTLSCLARSSSCPRPVPTRRSLRSSRRTRRRRPRRLPSPRRRKLRPPRRRPSRRRPRPSRRPRRRSSQTSQRRRRLPTTSPRQPVRSARRRGGRTTMPPARRATCSGSLRSRQAACRAWRWPSGSSA